MFYVKNKEIEKIDSKKIRNTIIFQIFFLKNNLVFLFICHIEHRCFVRN